jgi:hypothetical protein
MPPEAAREAVDPARLLPGENEDSDHLDDAEHWIEVYRELLAYKGRLLSVTESSLDSMAERPAHREVLTTDRAVILAERSRFERRLAFWQRRRDELRS